MFLPVVLVFFKSTSCEEKKECAFSMQDGTIASAMITNTTVAPSNCEGMPYSFIVSS